MLNRLIKLVGLSLARGLFFIPNAWLLFVVKGFLFVVSRRMVQERQLAGIFSVKDFCELIINERALVINQGIHPKHRVTSYYKFFSERIHAGASVIDLGCGYGAVAAAVAETGKPSMVVGLDYDVAKIALAKKKFGICKNLSFFVGDIYAENDFVDFDYAILSNVLEHIEDRVGLLSRLRTERIAKKLLVRVPDYRRSWEVAYRDSVGCYYFTDPDHKIEHTIEELAAELSLSGWFLEYSEIKWGEIWVVAAQHPGQSSQ